MKKRILFIGIGAMGGAVLRGCLTSGAMTDADIVGVVNTKIHAKALTEELGIPVSAELNDVESADVIVLGVKPQILQSSVLAQLSKVKKDCLIISMAAGIPLGTLEGAVPQAIWYRIMPNMPAAIGAGFVAVTAGTKGNDCLTAWVTNLLNSLGESAVVSEADLERLGALAGAGPGYAFVIMDALADAGVRIGLTRRLALRAAIQTLYGAGLMAIKTEQHPAVLRDQVTSPGGTTIAGIAAMEKGGLRSALHDGVVACYQRAQELGKKEN